RLRIDRDRHINRFRHFAFVEGALQSFRAAHPSWSTPTTRWHSATALRGIFNSGAGLSCRNTRASRSQPTNCLISAAMAGSPLHLCYGTQRVTVNLIEFWGFSGRSGGKGGKGLGSSGGKKGSNQQYSVDVAFGICQGPVAFD